MRVVAVAAFAGAVAAANVATTALGVVPIGFGLSVTAGTFAAGACLVARDAVDEAGGRPAVVVALALGVALSIALADPAIAVASAVAFAVAEATDWGVYRWSRRRRGRPYGVAVSSAVAAPLDTVVFLALAGFPVTLGTVAGQLLVKVGLAVAAAIALAWREGRRAVSVRV